MKTTITDRHGNIEQELSYDPWGTRRNPDTWHTHNNQNLEAPMFDRGYTGHEHLYAFGLINMNGRMYDPLTSSFLSVDAYVQSPDNAQSFNRYAYCSHNPLRYTDPTGWYQQTGSGYNINPKANLIGTTTYQSDDPCDMLWGRSVHPTQAANPSGYNATLSGFMVGNGFYGGGGIPASHLQAIRAWQNNPCAETSQALEDLGITVNVGCLLGSLNGVDGFRASSYSWTDANGQAYFSQALDYIGGNEHSYYSMTNKDPDSYDNVDMAGKLITTAGLYTYIEGMLHYSEILGKWMDKQGTRRPLHENGNGYTGGKIKYGKAVGEKFRRTSGVFNAVGVAISVSQCYNAKSTDDKIKYGSDVVWGMIGFAPAGAIISTFWFLGGRDLVFKYGETMGQLIKDGINPGMPAYQPFK